MVSDYTRRASAPIPHQLLSNTTFACRGRCELLARVREGFVCDMDIPIHSRLYTCMAK